MEKKEVRAFLKHIEKYPSNFRLYEMLNKIGSVKKGDIHIILLDYSISDGATTYRVYHKNGYCFDAIKEPDFDEEFTGNAYLYSFYSEWEGFDSLQVNDACIIIEKFMLTF